MYVHDVRTAWEGAIELVARQMVLVSDVLEHTGQWTDLQPLILGKYENKNFE